LKINNDPFNKIAAKISGNYQDNDNGSPPPV
jgi:hypothetical protein